MDCWFDRAERFRSDDPMVKVIHGMYLHQTGKSAEAVAKLEAARQLDSQDANLDYNLGLAYFDVGHYEKALQSAHRAYAAGFPLPGLREKFAAADEKVDRGRLKDKSVKGNAWRPAEGFRVPEKGAVFYYNGNFYDAKGDWIAKAAPSKKSGAVWQNGMWYDAATGKTLGRTVAAS